MQALVRARTSPGAILARPMSTPDASPGPGVQDPGARLIPTRNRLPRPSSRSRKPPRTSHPARSPSSPRSPRRSWPSWSPATRARGSRTPSPRSATRTIPALSVLVLDNGSDEDPTPRIAGVLPGRVRPPPDTNLGFAAAANDAMTIGRRRDVPALLPRRRRRSTPTRCASWSRRRTARTPAIVGPKLVDYDHPDVLLEVGMAVDHYGVPFSRHRAGRARPGAARRRARRLLRLERDDARAHRLVPRARGLRRARRSRAPTTSTCVGGRASPVRGCSSRPTRVFVTAGTTIEDDPRGTAHLAHRPEGLDTSPSARAAQVILGVALHLDHSERAGPERRRVARLRVHGPPAPGGRVVGRMAGGVPASRRAAPVAVRRPTHPHRRRRRRSRPHGPRKRAVAHVHRAAPPCR